MSLPLIMNKRYIHRISLYIYIYTVTYHSESRGQSPLLKGGVVRGHDKPRIMGVASHILSRWYIFIL